MVIQTPQTDNLATIVSSDSAHSRTIRKSRFLHLLERPGDVPAVYCLYHSLTQKKVYGGQILKEIYETISTSVSVADAIGRLTLGYPSAVVNKVISDLEEKGLAVPGNDSDLQMYLHYVYGGHELYSIRHMYFIPASECNLQCSYCFVEDKERKVPSVHMTAETSRKSMEIFARLTEQADRISMTFYGGEPLLNAEVVYSTMHYVRELEERGLFHQPVEMTLLTNGVLVNEVTVRHLRATHTPVSISIDGPQHLHDAARRFPGKKGSFAAALKAYRLLQDAGLNPGVSCTLTRHNIAQMDEVVSFIIDELRPAGMGFNILLPLISSGNPLDVDHAFAADQLILAFKRLREFGIYEDRVMRRVLPFTDSYFHFKDCMGVGGQLVVTADGRIGPCQAFQGLPQYFPWNVNVLHARLPEIDSDLIYSEPLFHEWNSRFPLNMQECADCFAIAVCGGGCPYAAQVNHGSIWQLDERICFQSKKILDWMIWETYDHMAEIADKPG